MQYINVSGYTESKLCEDEGEFFISVEKEAGKKSIYEALTTATEGSEYGFSEYIPSELLSNETVEVNLIMRNGENYFASEIVEAQIKEAEF